MLISIGTTVGSVFLSKGRPDLELKIDVVKLLTFPFFLILGVRYGIVGIATAVTLFSFLFTPVAPLLFSSLIGSRFRDYFLALYPAGLSSTVMALILFCYRYAQKVVFNLSNPILLVTSVLMGILVYFLTLKVARVRALEEMFEIIFSIIRPYTKSIAKKMSFNRQTST